MYIILFATIMMISAYNLYAAERFISPTGTGSACSEASPCSMNTVFTLEQSGDTVTFRGGTYTGSIRDTVTSGTVGTPTTLRAYTGETPIIVGDWVDAVIFTNGKSYITIDGLHLNGNGVSGNGMIIDGTGGNNIFKNMKIHHSTNQGVAQKNPQSNNTFDNVEIYSVGSGNTGFQHGIYLGSGTGHIIRNCYIHDNLYGYGMQLWEPGNNILVEKNTFYNNYRNLWVGGNNPIIRNNIMWKSVKDGVIVHSNTVDFFNNTITGAAADCGFVQAFGSNAEVRNNIIFGNSINICNPTYGSFSNNTTTDPSWVNPTAGDFRLKSISNSINNGLTISTVTTDIIGTVRPQGVAYDRGAYEFIGDEPIPTIPSPLVSQLNHTCNTPSNSLRSNIYGSLFYMPIGSLTDSTSLVETSCTSDTHIYESISVVSPGFSSIKPWHFLGLNGPSVNNSCEKCISVNGGSVSVNESGSGFTLIDFKEGSTIAAANNNLSPFATHSMLCGQIVNGVSTGVPLWPWPMNQRIKDARLLSVKPSIDVTAQVESMLGTIPAECRSDGVIEPPTPVATSLVFQSHPTTTTICPEPGNVATVLVMDQFSAPMAVTGLNVTAAIGDNPSAGVLSGTSTVSTVNGIATFDNWCISTAGVGYTLMATAPGLTGTESTAFTVTDDPEPYKLAFTTGPLTIPVYDIITPALVINVHNEQDLLVIDSTASITISLDNAVDGEELIGTLTKNAFAGVATFNDLKIAGKPKPMYTIRAVSSGLVDAVYIIDGLERTATGQAAGSLGSTPLSLRSKTR